MKLLLPAVVLSCLAFPLRAETIGHVGPVIYRAIQIAAAEGHEGIRLGSSGTPQDAGARHHRWPGPEEQELWARYGGSTLFRDTYRRLLALRFANREPIPGQTATAEIVYRAKPGEIHLKYINSILDAVVAARANPVTQANLLRALSAAYSEPRFISLKQLTELFVPYQAGEQDKILRGIVRQSGNYERLRWAISRRTVTPNDPRAWIRDKNAAWIEMGSEFRGLVSRSDKTTLWNGFVVDNYGRFPPEMRTALSDPEKRPQRGALTTPVETMSTKQLRKLMLLIGE